MKTHFKLGVEVNITGRYKKKRSTITDRYNYRITSNYYLQSFDTIKTGIIIGKRVIGTKTKHTKVRDSATKLSRSLYKSEVCERETVYLVACDMRGIMYVPESEVLLEKDLGDSNHITEESLGWFDDVLV